MVGTGRVQAGAGAAMLATCLLVGWVEARAVATGGEPVALAAWALAYVAFVGSAVLAAWAPGPVQRWPAPLLLGGPVVSAAALALLSPQRGGLVLILLVVTAALVAMHVSLRAVTLVVTANTLVVAAAVAGLGGADGGRARAEEVVLSAVLYALLQVGSAWMVWSQRRLEEALQEVSAAHVSLRSASVLLAESSSAQERLRISRELHDVLGHQLTVLTVQLEVAAHLAEGEARTQVVRARGLARGLLADVRSVVGVERERPVDLPAALATVVEGVPTPQVELRVEPGLHVDGPGAAVLVRALQEVATNTIRHADADVLRVEVTRDGEDHVRLVATDDGVGARAVRPGHGLTGLRERVEALGGRLDLDGARGFRVEATLPAGRRVGPPAPSPAAPAVPSPTALSPAVPAGEESGR